MKGQHRPNNPGKETKGSRRRRQRRAAADKYLQREKDKAEVAMKCDDIWAAAAGLDSTYLERRAMIQGWDTPADMRQKVVDRILLLILDPRVSSDIKVKCFRALVIAGQKQWEQDHPEQAGKAKGLQGTVVVNNQKVELNLDELRKLPTDELARVYQQALRGGFTDAIQEEIQEKQEAKTQEGIKDVLPAVPPFCQ